MKKYLLTLILLLIPTFGIMFRFGIHTMHDFHVFRQYEFDKCIKTWTFPCRWAADAGMGYGEPLFNYYGQFPYWVGQIFRFLNFSVIDSTKINFGLTLVLSALTMYLLARKFWGNTGAVVSAILYACAPYRAVDVWVRGALPEAMAFVFFPVILLCLKEFVESSKLKYLFWLILAFAGLIVTHNLSLVMFLPFALVWFVYFFVKSNNKSIHIIYDLISAGLVTGLLTAFYLLPVIFESGLVMVEETTTGYYDFHLHYVTLKQLFLSTFWGYGGSVWGPNDTMSFSIGYIHWVIAVVILTTLCISLLYRRETKERGITMVMVSLGLFAAFLTHGKAEFIWETIKPMAFIQFPWRFLTMSTLFLSLAAGMIVKFTPKIFWAVVLAVAIGFYSGNFRPDIWRSIGDVQQFTGKLWDEQRSSAILDFWPKGAKVPDTFAPAIPEVRLDTRFPIVYFPGWTAKINGQKVPVYASGPLSLLTVHVPTGEKVKLAFEDTWVRRLGNIVSALTLAGLLFWKWKKS
jgi:hypothetical protein